MIAKAIVQFNQHLPMSIAIKLAKQYYYWLWTDFTHHSGVSIIVSELTQNKRIRQDITFLWCKCNFRKDIDHMNSLENDFIEKTLNENYIGNNLFKATYYSEISLMGTRKSLKKTVATVWDLQNMNLMLVG